MSVVIETTLGDITVDLFLKERPRACLNFLKLCKMKYYNYNLFHTISRDFIAQTGDPTGSRNGGESIHGIMEGPLKRYFQSEKNPRIKHTHNGLVSFVGNEDGMIGSQFFITLGSDLTYLDEKHCIFGEVMEGLDVLDLLNETICDNDNRPYKDVRITHTVILDDPLPDFKMRIPSRSPSPSAERLQGGRIAADENIDDTEGKTAAEVSEMLAEREAKARATILEMVGDIPDAEMAPPENVLFVCKLNPVTTDDDLEIIFSRFGKIKSCEVIRDKKTGDSLQYAFVEFTDQKSCEEAYFKMDNVLIDDRRIHVDFSQSVAKIKWHGKGKGVTTYDDKGRQTNDVKNDLGKGLYKSIKVNKTKNYPREKYEERSGNQRDSYSRRNASDKIQTPDKYRRNVQDGSSNRKYAGRSRGEQTSSRETRKNQEEPRRNREESRDFQENSRGRKEQTRERKEDLKERRGDSRYHREDSRDRREDSRRGREESGRSKGHLEARKAYDRYDKLDDYSEREKGNKADKYDRKYRRNQSPTSMDEDKEKQKRKGIENTSSTKENKKKLKKLKRQKRNDSTSSSDHDCRSKKREHSSDSD